MSHEVTAYFFVFYLFFSVKGYLTLIGKYFVTYMNGLAVYVKEVLLFAQDLPLENSAILNYVFDTGFNSFSVLILFPLSVTFFVFMHTSWCYFI